MQKRTIAEYTQENPFPKYVRRKASTVHAQKKVKITKVMNGRALTDAQKETILRRYLNNDTLFDIAQDLGISYKQIQQFIKHHDEIELTLFQYFDFKYKTALDNFKKKWLRTLQQSELTDQEVNIILDF